MSILRFLRTRVTVDEVPENHFFVVHPLDDAPEEKLDTPGSGPCA